MSDASDYAAKRALERAKSWAEPFLSVGAPRPTQIELVKWIINMQVEITALTMVALAGGMDPELITQATEVAANGLHEEFRARYPWLDAIEEPGLPDPPGQPKRMN